LTGRYIAQIMTLEAMKPADCFAMSYSRINEVVPAGEYLGQFFEHPGFDVAGEWYIVGEFHGHEELSTKGKLGDIRGRPNEQDLSKVENDVRALIKSLQADSK